MKNPNRIHKKRLKRKKIAARHLAFERDQRLLARLPKQARIRVLQERQKQARMAKMAKRMMKKKKKKAIELPNLIPTNKPLGL